MKPYSQDLREKIVEEVENGETKEHTADIFGVSLSTVKRYVRQFRKEGHVRPKPIPGRPPTKRAPLEAALKPQLEEQPDATLQEHCERWKAASGVKVSPSTMRRAIRKLRWTRKKNIGCKREKRGGTASLARTSQRFGSRANGIH